MKIDVNFEVYKTGFLIYVKNDQGYSNLLKISSIINLESRDIDYDELVKYQEGLIIITSGLDSIIDRRIFNHDLEEAHRILQRFKKTLKISISGYFFLTLTMRLWLRLLWLEWL